MSYPFLPTLNFSVKGPEASAIIKVIFLFVFIVIGHDAFPNGVPTLP